MVKFKVPIKDILGKAYYRYTLTSTHYNTTPTQTDITITCTCKNIFGNPVTNKELTLYHQNNVQGTATTNANGIATWTVGNLGGGIHNYIVEDATLTINVNGWKSTSITNGTLYYNEYLRLCHLRYSRTFNSASANTLYEWGQLIPSTYRPPFMVTGNGNRNGATVTIDSDGYIYGRFQLAFNSSTSFYYSAMWHY